MIDVNTLRKDFDMLKQTMEGHPLVYFDNAATTLKPQSVSQRLMHYYTHQSVNIHRGDYELSFKLTDEVEKARQHVAKFIGAQSDEIIYTSGATQSLNQIAFGYGLNILQEGDVILTTQTEHASNLLPWFEIARQKKAIVKYFEVNEEGEITNFDAIDETVKIITIAHVSNVLGHINPIKEIATRGHAVGAIVVVDAAQSVPHLQIDVSDLDVDFMAFSGHKMLGPTGIGVLYGKANLLDDMTPHIWGGGANSRFNKEGEVLLKKAPARFEAGTPNIAGILGLDSAISYLEAVGLNKIHAYELELRQYAYEKMKQLDHVEIYNPTANTGLIAFNVKGIFAQDTCAYLSHFGFALRGGNHCAKILHEVIKAHDTCRLSLYLYNSKDEIDRFIEVLAEVTLEKTVDLYL